MRRLRARSSLTLGAVAVVSFAVAATTSAAFTDQATVNLGTGAAGSGLGNPRLFDIAVTDASAALQDAATPTAAVVLPTTPGSGLSEDNAERLNVTFTNRTTSILGLLTFKLYDPDPVTADVWADVRFTVYLDGSATPVISGATAAAVNTAAIAVDNVAAGESHVVRVDARLAAGTAVGDLGKTTQIGVRADGQSR